MIDRDGKESTRIVTINPETHPDGTVTVEVAVQDAVAVRIESVSSPYRIDPDGGVVRLIEPVDPRRTRAWQARFGRTVAQQVVDAVQQRLTTPPPPPGLQAVVAGEDLTGSPLEENEGALSKLLGFEAVTTGQMVQDSSFSFSPPPPVAADEEEEEETPRLSFWGAGALASFRGQEDTLSLDGEVSTALLGADWRTTHWQAGAALAHSWGNGAPMPGRTVTMQPSPPASPACSPMAVMPSPHASASGPSPATAGASSPSHRTTAAGGNTSLRPTW